MRCGPRCFLLGRLACIFHSMVLSPRFTVSQRFAVPWFCFQAPGRALRPFFLLPSNEGNGAPGGAGRFARPPLDRRRDPPAFTPSFRDPSSLRAVGVPGRAGPCEGPCASRRSIADRVVGGRTLLRHPVSRSTTPSIEQDMADIDQDAGSAKSETPVCKLLQHCLADPAAGPGHPFVAIKCRCA